MPIENRNMTPGTKLFAKYKKTEYKAEVIAGEEGKVLYKLEDGQTFKSPSAAGSAIMGGKACNGWRFWSVEESYDWANEEPSDEPVKPEESQSETESKPSTFRKVPNQRGVTEGNVRLYCNGCKSSFEAPVGEQPEACPQGHTPGESKADEEPES